MSTSCDSIGRRSASPEEIPSAIFRTTGPGHDRAATLLDSIGAWVAQSSSSPGPRTQSQAASRFEIRSSLAIFAMASGLRAEAASA